MEFKPQSHKKPIRSYVVRSGRMTDSQKSAFDKHWQIFGLDLSAGALDTATFAEPHQPLVVEIGFGMGESLLQMAAANPEYNYIGIEVHPPGVGRLMNEAAKAELNNLRVYMADALDVLTDCIADDSLERLQLYFPDPWHKKKHHKRRIVQPEFIQLVAQKLSPRGVFHLATDWEPYAEQMLELLEESPHVCNAVAPQQFAPRPDYRPITKFERRGERLGHGVWDLLYRKS